MTNTSIPFHGPNEEGPIQIFDGKVLQAQISDIRDPDGSGEYLPVLEFWLHPDIAPDAFAHATDDDEGVGATHTMDNPIQMVRLVDPQEAASALEQLDKAMVCVLGRAGVDGHRLQMDGGILSLIEDKDLRMQDAAQTRTLQGALNIASGVFVFDDIVNTHEEEQRSFDDVYEAMDVYAALMGWGPLSVEGTAILLRGMVADPINTPDVQVHVLEEQGCMVVTHFDGNGEHVHSEPLSLKWSQLHEVMSVLAQISENRGQSAKADYDLFFSMYEVLDERHVDSVIADFVPQITGNARRDAALRAFLSADGPPMLPS